MPILTYGHTMGRYGRVLWRWNWEDHLCSKHQIKWRAGKCEGWWIASYLVRGYWQTDTKERAKRTSENSAQITRGTRTEKECRRALWSPCPREQRRKPNRPEVRVRYSDIAKIGKRNEIDTQLGTIVRNGSKMCRRKPSNKRLSTIKGSTKEGFGQQKDKA